MSIIIFAMMEESYGISGRKAKSRTAIPRRWRYTVAQTAVDMGMNPNVFIKTFLKNADRNKGMKINERWGELREKSNINIQSEEGILKRQTQSIQTEGRFGE